MPEDLHPDFFDLSNQIAGGIFQKFVNYGFRIALILPVEHGFGNRIDELIHDHRSHQCVRFFTISLALQPARIKSRFAGNIGSIHQL
ncbi:MAG: DUF4180 domain-containing protein [bacterium]